MSSACNYTNRLSQLPRLKKLLCKVAGKIQLSYINRNTVYFRNKEE